MGVSVKNCKKCGEEFVAEEATYFLCPECHALGAGSPTRDQTKKCMELLENKADMDLKFIGASRTRCDYYGESETAYVLMKYQAKVREVYSSIARLLKYYDKFKGWKRYKDHPKEVQLIIYCDSIEQVKFKEIERLYNDYIANSKHPKIQFLSG